MKIGQILNAFHLKTSYPDETNDYVFYSDDEVLEFITTCVEVVLFFERYRAKEKIKTMKTLVDGLPIEINSQGVDLIEKQEVIGIFEEHTTLQDSEEEKVIQRIKEFFENKKQEDLRKE